MNGINKITDRIAEESRADTEAILTEAQEKCREIQASYDKQAQVEYDRIIREGKAESELQLQRFSSAAAMEAKKNILAMKQETISAILNESVDRICDLPEAEYTAFLAKLAGNAAFTGEEEIIFNSRDKSGCAKAVIKGANEILSNRRLPQNLSISSKTGKFKGGLMVKQGDIVTNCTVETLVEMSREKLSTQIAEILFAE